MAREEQQPDELKELERELRALVPRGPKVELARMMYLAGQASLSPVPPGGVPLVPAKPTGGWGWPVATGLMSLVALWLGALIIVLQTRGPLVQHAEPVPAPSAASPAPVNHPSPMPPIVVQTQVVDPTRTQADASYLRDRRTAIDEGVEAMPSATTGTAPAVSPGSYGSLRNGILREQRRTTHRATMWSELWNQ